MPSPALPAKYHGLVSFDSTRARVFKYLSHGQRASVCACVCVRACVRVCVYGVCVCMYARVHARIHARASVCMCVFVCVRVARRMGGIRRVVACDVADVREREQRRDIRVIHQVAVAKPVHLVPVRACVRACARLCA